ncbi:penicillin amidase [Granulicella pectinivorans]|uniref:Penicillin amidase n=1 Tax=Granulicella pectinivorans TaxID=474950 RepID=A0A1I6MCU1_9BACT|nr:penicillin acylase family protein [Granulicella pectinivorans]SFS13524.1 penicillin amidase [Granulicella pectinivorans]
MHPLDPTLPEPELITRQSPPEPGSEFTPGKRRYGLFDLDRPRPGRLVRILGLILPILLAVGLVAYATAMYYSRKALIASLPQLDGTLSVPGLSAPVTVLRDAQGVPHIRAANLDDLLLAQGYVTAQDRLWQMDGLRRNAAGDLAEVLGSALIDHDRIQRILQIRASAERTLATLPPNQFHELEQYAKGVNASIAAQRTHLPFEFIALRYEPAPWTPTDTLLIGLSMFQQLSNGYTQKLAREAISAKLPPELLADLYPVGSWRDHPPGHTIDLSIPVEEIEQIPLDESQSKLNLTPDHVNALLQSLSPCGDCIPGSNNWVVSGAHSTTGKPILANDTHLAHTVPGIWYETDLEAPLPNGGSFHAAGVAIPGTPFIEIGHNAHLAWGMTVLPADTQDVYIERIQNNQYQSPDGAFHPIEHRTELIKVRNGTDVSLDVKLTRHGNVLTPIISSLFHDEKRPLSLRWTIYDPTTLTAAFGNINAASDWPSFNAALSQYGGPPMNLVYADDQGHIAFHAIGRIPTRGIDPAHPEAIPPVPTDATAPDALTHEWSGFIPYEQLPSAIDPPGGILATANARTAPDGYPYPIALNWASPYRNERIWKQLASKPRFSPADMIDLQTDVYSDLDHVIAQRLAYAIDHAIDHPAIDGKPRPHIDQKQLHDAADLLRSWNGKVDANSSAAAIVDATRAALWAMLLNPRLGQLASLYTWGSRDYAEEQLIMHTPDRWLPKSFATWDDLLTEAVLKGISASHAPFDITKWRSGSLHPVDIEHPIYSQSEILKALIGRPIGTGTHPQSGDLTTVKQVDRTFGPSQRLTVDLSNPDNTTLNVVLGQSGNPASPNFLDQFPFWLAGKTFPFPFSHETIRATHTLILK